MSTSYTPRIVDPPAGSIRAADAALKLWGDATSGFVNDWIFVSNETIHTMVFSLAPGARFGHSPDYRTNLGADEIYHVLTGVLVLANPETGEVHRIEPGEAIAFGPDTWHHGVNHSTEELRVVEFFAPPPATGASQPYANTRPYLDEPRYVQDGWLGRWPSAQEQARAGHTQRPVRRGDVMWRLEGRENPLLTGISLSTDQLTSGCVELLPGQRGDPAAHGGELSGYVVAGRLNLCLLDPEGNSRRHRWFEAVAGDGFRVPAGAPYQYFNMTAEPVRLLFGVAPSYLPPDADPG